MESVIVLAPRFKLLAGVSKIEEQVGVQAFVAQTAVEALDKAVLCRLARPDEIQLHARLMGPGIHCPAAKLRAVVHGDGLRHAADPGESLQAGDDLDAAQRDIGPEQRALTTELVDDRQHPKVAAVLEAFRHEVHRPTLVRPSRDGQGHAGLDRTLPPLLGAYEQVFLSIQPVDKLLAHPPAFALQQDRQRAVAVAHPGERQLLQPQEQGAPVLRMRVIPVALRAQEHQPARLDLAGDERRRQPVHDRALARRPQTFFASTSWSIRLSRLRSATRRFRELFSSSNCLRRRSSLTPNPSYCFFQR